MAAALLMPCRNSKAEENLVYELGFQKFLSRANTKPRVNYVKYGISVSLGLGTLSEGCVELTQRKAVLPLQE